MADLTGMLQAAAGNVGGAEGWDLSTAVYESLSFSVSSQITSSHDVFFKDDGTKMYALGFTNKTIYQYSLSTAWDVSSASYDSASFSVVSQESSPVGMFFKPDGTKLYVIGAGNDTVYQYSLSSAWSISTASYDSASFSVSTEGGFPQKLFFKDDGTKMYTVDFSEDKAFQYSLSTAWDISSASYDSVSLVLTPTVATEVSIFFKSNGTKMYIADAGNDAIYQYSLATAWNISTATYDSVSLSIASQENNVRGMFFKPDGTKLYVIGLQNTTVYQYGVS